MIDVPSYNGSNLFIGEEDLDYIRCKICWYKSELERLQKELEKIKAAKRIVSHLNQGSLLAAFICSSWYLP